MPANGCSTCRCWRRIKLVAPDDGLTQWSARRMVGEMAKMCEGLDPLAPADENRLANMPPRGPIISTTVNSRGCTLFSLGFLLCREIWQVRPRSITRHQDVNTWGESKLAQADSVPMPECCASALIITARRW